MKKKSAVRIMLLLLKLMCIFQASNANLLNEYLIYFCWQQLYNEVHQIDDVTNKSCKNDKYMCSFQPNIKSICCKVYNACTNIKREKYTLEMHINYKIGIQTSIVLIYGT